MVILCNCCTTHNSTHSVHNRLLKLWRVRLLHLWPCCYVPSPPLSGANPQPFPPPGGPGPPASKMASFSPGSTHTPFPLSVTTILFSIQNLLSEEKKKAVENFQKPPHVPCSEPNNSSTHFCQDFRYCDTFRKYLLTHMLTSANTVTNSSDSTKANTTG
jgi:hypothetical protein